MAAGVQGHEADVEGVSCQPWGIGGAVGDVSKDPSQKATSCSQLCGEGSPVKRNCVVMGELGRG